MKMGLNMGMNRDMDRDGNRDTALCAFEMYALPVDILWIIMCKVSCTLEVTFLVYYDFLHSSSDI
jgi:hypothetical protein